MVAQRIRLIRVRAREHAFESAHGVDHIVGQNVHAVSGNFLVFQLCLSAKNTQWTGQGAHNILAGTLRAGTPEEIAFEKTLSAGGCGSVFEHAEIIIGDELLRQTDDMTKHKKERDRQRE